MRLRTEEEALFGGYLEHFADLSGDRRTRAVFNETVRGIIGSESLCCNRIAALSPLLAATPGSERRIRRMVHGETTKRSTLDADTILARLQTRGVAQLREEEAVWVIVDGSDLRKPHARAMESLQEVKPLRGGGTIPGYRTINAIGLGKRRRGLLYHRLFSGTAEGFLSESSETQQALTSIGGALQACPADITYILDAGFDDAAVWATIWQQGHHLVGRVQHRDRLVRPGVDQPPCHLYDLAPRLRPLATAEAELVVRLGKQRQAKLQPVTATIAAVPLVVSYQEEVRTRPDGAQHAKPVWLVEVRLEGAHERPWWLLTDRPVTSAEAALEVFRMCCQRWSIEDFFKIGKQCLGWEDVQVLTLAAGFLYELGLTLDWPEVRLLVRLGGGEERPNRPVGKLVLTRGLRRLLDHLATDAILADEVRQHGSFPPRLAALLRRTAAP